MCSWAGIDRSEPGDCSWSGSQRCDINRAAERARLDLLAAAKPRDAQ